MKFKLKFEIPFLDYQDTFEQSAENIELLKSAVIPMLFKEFPILECDPGYLKIFQNGILIEEIKI